MLKKKQPKKFSTRDLVGQHEAEICEDIRELAEFHLTEMDLKRDERSAFHRQMVANGIFSRYVGRYA